MEGQLAVRLFLDYVKRISVLNNQLELHKRRLAELVHQIQDYIQCFRAMDLDKKGKVTPKVLQNWLISKKHYHKPEAISRYYSKYSHQKAYLSYEDVLEALLPNADYILVSHTLTNASEYANKPSKFTYSCQRELIESIQHLTAFIVSQELKALDRDYERMRNITRGSQRIGAILWRILDRNHANTVDYEHIKMSAQEIGIQLLKQEWDCFLHWHFHSYKASINRDHFMRLLDIHQERKRATSACRIDQFKVQKELFRRAEEEKARNDRIKRAVEEKLAMVPLIGRAEYLNIMREEHFPYELLNSKRELKGKRGYCNPTNLVKYVAER